MTRTHLERIITIVLALSIGSAASAQSSQDEASRAKALSTARDQKAETITPPARSLTERVLYWYDNRDSSLSWNGLHVNMGNFSGGAGFAAGVGFTRHAIGSPRSSIHSKPIASTSICRRVAASSGISGSRHASMS